jgi:hypothetical protein
MKKSSFKYVYAIVGTTEYCGRANLYCTVSLNGFNMVQFGYSIAREFETKKRAREVIMILKEKFKGIKEFKLEYRKVLL